MRHFRLVIQILYGHADFEVVAVFGKDRVYQFRKYIVAGYRSNHTAFDIVGKFLFRSCRIELKECFQESGSVLNCVGTFHVFNCYLHQDEATPHLHIDFVPYVTGWKGKGMDTRVSLKQALKSLGFQGGNKHDTELNQWINHEKELLAEIARQHGIEWEQKGTHEEHLDVYNFKKKERKKEVQALEQEKEYLTAENEGLTAQITEARADIQLLKDDKEQAVKDKEEAEKRAEKAEKDLCSLEERRERLQPVMDNVSKEIKEYGTVKTLLPEAGTLECATTYRDKKIKPLQWLPRSKNLPKK